MTTISALHLVNLSGGGDTEIKLVGPATFSWICSPWTGRTGQTSVDETVPDEVAKEGLALNPMAASVAPSSCRVSVGSPDNDRALFAVGMHFDSATKACKWAFANGCELGDEFDGYIY